MLIELQDVRLADYEPVIGADEVAEIRRLASYLKGAKVLHVNSTAVGGGVAEILARLVPLMRDVGLDARWQIFEGSADFFKVTKAFHNALHGADERITPEMYKTFLEAQEENTPLLQRDCDFYAIHDPQPVGLIEAKAQTKAKWVWRCHIDIADADPAVWGFLSSYVSRYDSAIFHLPNYAKELPIPQLLIAPAIDPLHEKNIPLPPEEIEATLRRYQIDPRRPIVVQVSRFDRLKDPVGVIRAYRLARRMVDCQLVLAGGSAADDPEGREVLAEVEEAANQDPDIHILNLPPDAHRTVNALQRGATVVVQKSLREGFGLVVTEAMWKAKPMIGSNVGGIRHQIIDSATGYLVSSIEGCAFRMRQLLGNPGLARRLGENAQEAVRTTYLTPTYLKNWLLTLLAMRHGRESTVQLDS
ncbi:MAG: glycosyltransferase [Myxococcaceae bacterium]